MSTQKRVSYLSENFLELPTYAGVLSRLAAERMIQSGIEVGPFLAQAGLPPNLLEDPAIKISAKSQISFLSIAEASLSDHLLGFHLALSFDLRELGSFYYHLASCDTLGHALEAAVKLNSVINEGIRIRTKRATLFSIDFDYVGLERHLDHHQIEFWMTCTLRLCRHLTKLELIPSYIGFVHRHDGDVSELERYFACRVSFQARQDRISLELQAADLPLATVDPYLNRILSAYHRDTIEQHHTLHEPLRVRVENCIVPRLPDGTASIVNISNDLGMSSRTLARRLADEGLTFSSVLEELRSDLANRYLLNRSLSISQISWLLGYRELSSFVHAFQRWTGMSPTEVRRQSRRTITSNGNDGFET